MIEFKGVTVSSRMGETLLSDVDFRIEEGDKIAVCGPSGAGKTTLLKALIRFYPVKGMISLFGNPLSSLSNKALRQTIFYLPQVSYRDEITVGEFIDEPLTFKENSAIRERYSKEFERISDTLGLMLKRNERLASLSGGEFQRLSLARGFALEKRLYLLDEPSSALDVGSVQRLGNIIQSSCSTFIVVTHDWGVVSVMDYVVFVKEGRFVDIKSVSQVSRKEFFAFME